MSDDASTENPVFRRGTVADAPGILRVIESAFPQWPPFEIDVSPLQHLQWKMTPPEPLPRDQHAVVELDGEIVATQIRWPSTVYLHGEQFRSDQGADISVHISAQGKGLARLIRRHERERIHGQRIVALDTGVRHERMIHMQEGDERIRRPLNVWTRTSGPRTFVGTHLRGGGLAHFARTSGEALLRAISALQPDRRSPTAPPTIEVTTHFDERATELWSRVASEYDLARVRDAAWLNWRYADPRASLISCYVATEGNQLLGYAVFRRSHDRGSVLDLVTERGNAQVGAALLRRGVSDLQRAGCRLVQCLLAPGHREEAALRAAGFRPAGVARALDFQRARHVGLPELMELAADPASRLHVMLGDFDHS